MWLMQTSASNLSDISTRQTVPSWPMLWRYARWSHQFREEIRFRLVDLSHEYQALGSECERLIDDLERRRHDNAG